MRGLPQPDAQELLRAIHAVEEGNFAVRLNHADRARSQEAGFDHHFVKPVDPKVLLRHLDKHSARREELRSRRAN